ncbi:MAG: MerR family transcriptional regulator [Anaerolineae bacterium]|jgi:DNA-binding transcriptional MerR regulator|nr:MerR family transcriptional regulator [Anaerolineae bacterium]
MYSVKQVAELANISIRTLHYYHEIGLLIPTHIEGNGYRRYDRDALLRLQQILLYRQLGFDLEQIRALLAQTSGDWITALEAHRTSLQANLTQLQDLLHTVDETIAQLKGGHAMNDKRLFKGFSDEQQKDYEREIRLQYGPDLVNLSVRNWNSYSKVQREVIFEEGNALYAAIVKAIEAGRSHDSVEVQELMTRWHQHIRYFYEPTLEILRGLGQLYTSHPDFIANFSQLHPELARFMESAIDHYVDDLETAEITRLLSEDSNDHHQA